MRRAHLVSAIFSLGVVTWLGAALLDSTVNAADTSNPQTRLARTDQELYQAACASCHGPDGKGMPQSTVGFEVPLPDFSDCSFATREPDVDWGAVVHSGGPTRAFDKMMPAFGEILSEEQIQQTLNHVRTFCDRQERDAWPRGELNLPRPLLTSKAFPEDEAVVASTVNLEGSNAVMNELVYETRIGARGQVEVVLPFGFLENDQDNWTGGIGDIALGTKWAVLHSVNTGSILSLSLEVLLPTGREDRGLGKGVTLLEPFVAFGQILPADGFFQFQGGAELSTEPDDAGHEVFWRGALGMTFAQGRHGRAWSPMVEIAGARELEDDAKIHWDAIPQLQVSLPTRQHVLACAGVRIPINEFDPRTTQLMLYLLWDWFDGGFAEGW